MPALALTSRSAISCHSHYRYYYKKKNYLDAGLGVDEELGHFVKPFAVLVALGVGLGQFGVVFVHYSPRPEGARPCVSHLFHFRLCNCNNNYKNNYNKHTHTHTHT